MPRIATTPSVEEQMNGNADYSVYRNAAPTDLQDYFPEWIMEKLDITPTEYKTKAQAFADGVRLATVLRMGFQRSPENLKRREARREAQDQVKLEEAAERKANPTRRGRPPKAQAVEEEEMTPPPRKRGRPRKTPVPTPEFVEPAPVEPPKPAVRRRGRPRKVAATVS